MIKKCLYALIILMCGAMNAMAIEEAAYTVVEKDGEFEIRDYAPQLLAEIVVDGTLETAASNAFDALFNYISGANTARSKMAMTAPVAQTAQGEKIAMTAPVEQQRVNDQWVVSFMMPASYTLATLPQPTNTHIVLRAVPAHRAAVVRYSGFWSEANYLKHKNALDAWMAERHLAPIGEPVWARYNPPFMPWFLRRNEILIPIK